MNPVVRFLRRQPGELAWMARIGEIEDDKGAVQALRGDDEKLSIIADGDVA